MIILLWLVDTTECESAFNFLHSKNLHGHQPDICTRMKKKPRISSATNLMMLMSLSHRTVPTLRTGPKPRLHQTLNPDQNPD